MKKIFVLFSLFLAACSVEPEGSANNSGENTTTTTTAECDGDQIDGDEICDGADLSDNSCVSLGFPKGALKCKADCSNFDLSACGAPETCGNGRLDVGEVCDGEDLAGASCQFLGIGEGAISCDQNCLGLDISICDLPLVCEPECPGNLTCERGVCSGPLSNIIINEVGFDVSGNIQIEGRTPLLGNPTICSDVENVALVVVIFIEPILGYRFDVVIECGDNFAFNTRLPIGIYEVRLRVTRRARTAEINLFHTDYLVQRDLKIDKNTPNLIFNEVGFDVSGRIQVQGRPPVFGKPSRCNDIDSIAAQLVFTEPILGYRVVSDIGCLDNFTFRAHLPVGIYEVRLRARGNGGPAQINLFELDYLVEKNLVVDENITDLIFNEAGFDLSGKIQVEEKSPIYGDPTICEASENAKVAEITFIEPTLGYRITSAISCIDDFLFQTRLPIGTFEVRLRIGRAGRQAQINLFDVNYLVLKNLKIDKDISNLFLNEVGFDVAGKIQVEGQPPVYGDPAICNDLEDAEIAEVVFTETALGYRLMEEIKCGDNFAFQTRLPVGTYEVQLHRGRDARRTQINLFYVDYIIQKDLKIDKNIPSLVLNEVGFDMSGEIQVEGESPVYDDPSVCQDFENVPVAVIVFTETTLGYRIVVVMECKDDFTFQTRLPIGTYKVRLKGWGGSRAQINLLDLDYLIQDDLKIDKNISKIVFNEIGFDVAGKIQVEGSSPVFGEPSFCDDEDSANRFVANLEFLDVNQGYRMVTGIKCADNFEFNARLPSGIYAVRLTGQNVFATQINLFDVSYLGISKLLVE